MSVTNAVREKPILFSGPMVQAILDGRKSQTRRVVKPQPHPSCSEGGCGHHWHPEGREDHYLWHETEAPLARAMVEYCPYGQPSDRLWVRETWQAPGLKRVFYKATENPPAEIACKWCPSIHMPRWASRITLEITGVRVERLQDISAEDIAAEGFPVVDDDATCTPIHEAFANGWNAINSKRPGCSWESNPWVWALTFRRLEAS